MPVVEFTFSEQAFYEDKRKQATLHIQRAEQEAREMVGTTLATICQSHNQEPPPNSEVLKDAKGKILGLIWGSDLKDYVEGKFSVPGAVHPKQNPKKTPAVANDGAKSAENGAAPLPLLTEGAPAPSGEPKVGG